MNFGVRAKASADSVNGFTRYAQIIRYLLDAITVMGHQTLYYLFCRTRKIALHTLPRSLYQPAAQNSQPAKRLNKIFLFYILVNLTKWRPV